MNIVFLWLLFVLVVCEFVRILTRKKKTVRFKQLIRNTNGRKMYRIDYLSRPKGGKGLRW